MLFAGLCQMMFLAWANFRNGLSFSLSFPKIDDDVKIFFKKFLPGAIGSGVTQINLLVASIFASQIPGAISWLYYSDRVAQLPLGIYRNCYRNRTFTKLSKENQFRTR